MKITWTEIQQTRLKELEADESDLHLRFDGTPARDQAFQQLEKKLVKVQRQKLQQLRDGPRRPGLCRLESRLTDILIQNDFVQVTTPTILSKGLLAKMSIDDTHPLASQIFWLDKDKCLRPMLAPHLYFVLQDLLRIWEKPVRIFEVGSCFRKESQGARHSNEFTMLNLVEMGLAEDKRQKRLEELAALVTGAAGVDDYIIQSESSAVYGETIDILAGENRPGGWFCRHGTPCARSRLANHGCMGRHRFRPRTPAHGFGKESKAWGKWGEVWPILTGFG